MGNFFKDIVRDPLGTIEKTFYRPVFGPIGKAADWVTLQQYKTSQKHKLGDIQGQFAASMASMPKMSQLADYSIIEAIMKSRRAAGAKSGKSQGILTNPLGLGSGGPPQKKMLLGQ